MQINPNYPSYFEPMTEHEQLDLSPITDALEDVKRAVLSNKAKDSVEVVNFDEVKKHLRVELGLLADKIKPIIASIADSMPEAVEEVTVKNFPKQEKVESVEVNNLSELGDKLAKLLYAVQSINVTPVVNVPAPIVNVPPQEAPVVNIPQSLPPIVDLDLSALLAALKPLGLLSRDPNKPITVRMSDGRSFIDAIANTLKENGERLATVVSTSYGLTQSEYMTAQRNLTAENLYKKGMEIPYHNSQVIDETDPDNVTITYKLDGTTVATKTIAVSGAVTTITVS